MDQNTKEIFDWKAIAIEELGMGKRTENAAKRLGIQTAEDLLYHFPYTYEAYPVPLPVYRIPEGRRAIRVILDQFMDYSGKLPKIRTHDPSGTIWVRWFHPPYTVKDFSPGDIYVFVGEISYFHGYPQMTQPQIYTPKEYEQMTGTMQPVYPLTRGLTQFVLRKYTSLLLQGKECPETLSIEVMEKYGLCSRTDALHWIHYPKTKETLDIETALEQMCREKRIYGCKEVTIGFPHQKMGNEICDFVTMDSKGTFRCYEIKVSLADLQSSAKKSWYGMYNYLVITKELADKVGDWDKFLSKEIGILVLMQYASHPELYSIRKAKRKVISSEMQNILQESLIRTLYNKMEKYRSIADGRVEAKLKKELSELQKSYKREKELELRYCEEYMRLRSYVRRYKNKTGIDITKAEED